MLFISVHLTKMSIKFALLIVLSIASIQSSMHVDHGLTSLHFEGLPDKIFAGEIHYARIPVEYWEHRIKMVKAMGLNSLSVYIMWNYHETEKGHFDYQTGNKNLSHFLDLAEKYNMNVLFRPGPYVCAEWDFGGLPARLLSIEGLQIRANNELFLEETKIYFQSLVPIIQKHLKTSSNPQGSIILLQIENQYGFYGHDKFYIEALRLIWEDLGVQCPQYYVDQVQNALKSHWQGANIGINDGVVQVYYEITRIREPKGTIFGGEIYTGWLTHWYEEWQTKSVERNLKEFSFLMNYNHSYSMYMAHGGTNFGLTAGANGFKGQDFDYRGHVTSYDYEAPINEQGSPTPKYTALRELIMKFVSWDVIDVPEPLPTMEIPSFTPTPIGSIWENLPSATISSTESLPLFESSELRMFNQGFVVYEASLTKILTYKFQAEVHDYGLVFLDGEFITTLDRSSQAVHKFSVECKNPACQLRILVEATGHINFGEEMLTDRKGIIRISDNFNPTIYWNVYKVPIDQSILKWSKLSNKNPQPTLLKAEVTLNEAEIGDTYLDMSGYTKGYVWVNGHNLGRYWKVGPQQRLFCPGVWLTRNTTIYILELHFSKKPSSISGFRTLVPEQSEQSASLNV